MTPGFGSGPGLGGQDPTHNISAEEIFRSVPFCLEHKEHLTNSMSVEQISRSAPYNKEA